MKWRTTLCLSVAMISLSCARNEDGNGDHPRDQNAQPYRLFYDAPGAAEAFRASWFPGQIRVVDVERLLGDRGQWSKDDAGNAVAGVRLIDGHLWSAVFDPSLEAVNVVSISPEGAITSVFDFDGDGVADLVDVRLGDDRRYSFADDLGLEFFSRWLQGRDPLCDGALWEKLAISGFECSADSGGGDGASRGNRSPLYDPVEAMCAQYRDPPGAVGLPVMTQEQAGYGSHRRFGGYDASIRDPVGRRNLSFVLIVNVYSDESGNHVSTYREVRYYDSEEPNFLVRTVVERVDRNGQGTRTVTDYDRHGVPHRRPSERFETEVNDDGTYDAVSPWKDRDAPEKHREAAEEDEPDHPAWPELRDTTEGHPGPVDVEPPDGGWEAWCAATAPGRYRSGAEIAAGTDLTVFRDPICVSPESSADRPGNCVELDRAGSKDFRDILDAPSVDDGCGDFEQPGPDWTCGPRAGSELLEGRIAELMSAELADVQLCDPRVCDPGIDP